MLDTSNQTGIELEELQSTISDLRARLTTPQCLLNQDEAAMLLRMFEQLERARDLAKHEHQDWMAAVNVVDDLIFLHDGDFRVLRANLAYQRQADLPLDKIIGRPYYEVFPRRAGPLPGCLNVIDEHDKIAEEEVAVGDRLYHSRSYPVHDEIGQYQYSVHSLVDITERKHYELSLQRANRALRTISAGNQTLILAAEEQALLQDMCRVAVDMGGYRLARIVYLEEEAGAVLKLKAQAGSEGMDISALPICSALGPEECTAMRAIENGNTVVVQDILEDASVSSWHRVARQAKLGSCITLPLRNGQQAFGAFVLFDEKVNIFDADEIILLEELADDLAYGIQSLRIKAAHAEHQQRLQQNMLQTVQAIASIVEMRDPYTSGHQARVADLAEAIARELGLAEDVVQSVHLAGLVHDLGKIRVPAEILSKPGQLKEAEFALIKLHPEAGYDILKGVEFSWPIAQMVLQHHERMDGSGYPQGLKGEQILPGARIIAVADLVEAMSSFRPYRPGIGLDVALAEIIRQRGQQLDAEAVDACLKLFREGYRFAGER